jgi:hypothetical protein
MSLNFRKFYPQASAKAEDAKAPAYSPTCEVPGCDTRWIPASNGFPVQRLPGLTAAIVNDYGGLKRAICGEHYIRGLVKAGKHPNQALMNSDGSMSPVLVKEHWAKLDAEAKP